MFLIEHQDNYDYLTKILADGLIDITDKHDIHFRVGIYPDIYHSVNLEQRFDRALHTSNSVSKNSNHDVVFEENGRIVAVVG